MNTDTRRALRTAYHRSMVIRPPARLTLPQAQRPDAPTAAGRLAGLGIALLVAAAFWAGILGIAWMIAGWLL